MVNFNDIIATNTGTDALSSHAMQMVIKNTSLKRYLQVKVGYIPTGLKCNKKTPEGFEILEKSAKYITSFENYITEVLRSKKWVNSLQIKNSEPTRYKAYHYNDIEENVYLRYEYISPDYTVICRLFSLERPSEYRITFQFTGEPITIPDEYYEKPKKQQYDFYGNIIEPIDTETAKEKSNEYWEIYIKQKEYTLQFNIEFNNELQFLFPKYKDDPHKLKIKQIELEDRLRKKHGLDSEEYLAIAEKEKELRKYLIRHTPRSVIQSVLKSYQLNHPCADLCRLFRKAYGLKGYHDEVTKKSWYDNQEKMFEKQDYSVIFNS